MTYRGSRRGLVAAAAFVALIAAFTLASTAQASHKKPRPVTVTMAYNAASEIAYDTYLADPDAYDYSVDNCFRTARNRAQCDAHTYGTRWDGYYFTDYQCDWTNFFWTKRRPRNTLFFSYTEPVCYVTGQFRRSNAGKSQGMGLGAKESDLSSRLAEHE